MADKNRTMSLLALTVVLAAAVQAVVGRDIPTKNSNDAVDKKQPQWLLGHDDNSFHIPGIGRVMVPPKYGHHFPNLPYHGSTGSPALGGGSVGGGSHIPGGDDNLVPNPGVEVPNPVGGAIPSPP